MKQLILLKLKILTRLLRMTAHTTRPYDVIMGWYSNTLRRWGEVEPPIYVER